MFQTDSIYEHLSDIFHQMSCTTDQIVQKKLKWTNLIHIVIQKVFLISQYFQECIQKFANPHIRSSLAAIAIPVSALADSISLSVSSWHFFTDGFRSRSIRHSADSMKAKFGKIYKKKSASKEGTFNTIPYYDIFTTKKADSF